MTENTYHEHTQRLAEKRNANLAKAHQVANLAAERDKKEAMKLPALTLKPDNQTNPAA